MSIYPVSLLDASWQSKLKGLTLQGSDVETVEGLILLIRKDLRSYMAASHGQLNKGEHEQVMEWIRECRFIKDREALACAYHDFLGMNEPQLWKTLGDFHFDVENYDESFYYYDKVLRHSMDEDVLVNAGLLMIRFGDLEEGLKWLEKAYVLHGNESIYLLMLKVKTIFGVLVDEQILHDAAESIVHFDDRILDFLIWYHDYFGDKESSATSYLRLNGVKEKLKHMTSYMSYMMESGQMQAMESTLKELKDIYPKKYIQSLVTSMVELERFEEAIAYLDNEDKVHYSDSVYILKSLCYTECGQIIQGIRCMNQVETDGLTYSELEMYYKQLVKLAGFSKDISKEHDYYQHLLSTWKQKYRRLWLAIKNKREWKVEG